MPTWIFVCLWVIWSLWLLVEVTGFMQMIAHNSNRILVALQGKVHYTNFSLTWSLVFIVLTVFWIGYNVSRWF